MKIKSLYFFSSVLLPVSIAAFVISSCASNEPKPAQDVECVGDVAMMGAMSGMGANTTSGGMGMSGSGGMGMSGSGGMGMSGMGMSTGTGTTTGSAEGDEETKLASAPCEPANKTN